MPRSRRRLLILIRGFAGEVLALVEDPLHRHPMTLAGASGVFTPRHVLVAAPDARSCWSNAAGR